jgi:MoaA/NifB/PqqE/SkfB family radical SAM enzyme
MQSESPQAGQGGKQQPSGKAGTTLAFLRLLARDPGHIVSLLRTEYRRRLGIRLDRCLHPATSGLPVNLNINLTRRCNLACEMCIQHRHDDGDSAAGVEWYDPKRELPLAAWVRLMEQVEPFRPTLFVTGGEPTLYREFEGFIREAKRRRLFVHLATNGLTLEKHAAMLVEQGVEFVTVSLDGTAAVHDLVRGQMGLFARTTRGINALVAERQRRRGPAPLVSINFTISKANLGCIPDIVPLALELQTDSLQFQHTIFSSRAHIEKHNRLLSPEAARTRGITIVAPSIPEGEFYESGITADDAKVIARHLQTAREQARGKLRLTFLPDLAPEMIGPYYLDLDHPFRGQCGALWKTLRVMPDGTVSSCLHVVAGNIATQTVGEIWNGPAIRPFREMIAHGLLPGCARCCNRSFS